VLRKIIFFVCASVLIIIASLAGAIFYYYTHPASVKALMETSIARATGMSVAIRRLSYSLDPLRVTAKGIILTPGQKGRNFHFEVPELDAEGSIGGPFGQKTLTVNRLEIEGLSGRISYDTDVPGTPRRRNRHL